MSTTLSSTFPTNSLQLFQTAVNNAPMSASGRPDASKTSLILSIVAAVLATLVLSIYLARLVWKWRSKGSFIQRGPHICKGNQRQRITSPVSTSPSEIHARRLDDLEKALHSDHYSFMTYTRSSADARSQSTFPGRSSVSTRHLPITPTTRTLSMDSHSVTTACVKQSASLDISSRNALAISPSKKYQTDIEGGFPLHAPAQTRLASFFSKASLRSLNQTKDRYQDTTLSSTELGVLSKDGTSVRKAAFRAPVSPSTRVHSLAPKLALSLPSPLTPNFTATGNFGESRPVSKIQQVLRDTESNDRCRIGPKSSHSGMQEGGTQNGSLPRQEPNTKVLVSTIRTEDANANMGDLHEEIKQSYGTFMNSVDDCVFDEPSSSNALRRSLSDPQNCTPRRRLSKKRLSLGLEASTEEKFGRFNSRFISMLIDDLTSDDKATRAEANQRDRVSRTFTLAPAPLVSQDLDGISDEAGIISTPLRSSKRNAKREGMQVKLPHRPKHETIAEDNLPIPRPLTPLIPREDGEYSPAFSSGSSKAPSPALSSAPSTPQSGERPCPISPHSPDLPSPEVSSFKKASRGWMMVSKLKIRPASLSLTHPMSGDVGLQMVDLDPEDRRVIGFGRAAPALEKGRSNHVHPRSSQSTGSLYSGHVGDSCELRVSRSSSSLAKDLKEVPLSDSIFQIRARKQVSSPSFFPGFQEKVCPPPPNPVLPPELEAVYPLSEGSELPYFDEQILNSLGGRPAGVRTSLVDGLRDTLRKLPSLRKLVGPDSLEVTSATNSSQGQTQGHVQTQQIHANSSNLRTSDDVFVIGDDSDRLGSP